MIRHLLTNSALCQTQQRSLLRPVTLQQSRLWQLTRFHQQNRSFLMPTIRSFTDKNSTGSSDQHQQTQQAKMDTFASKISKDGVKTQKIKKKAKLQEYFKDYTPNNQNQNWQQRQDKSSKSQMQNRSSSYFNLDRDQSGLSKAYIQRFGVPKSELIQEFLTKEGHELEEACKYYGIIIKQDDFNNSDNVIRQLNDQLTKFETLQTTHAEQREQYQKTVQEQLSLLSNDELLELTSLDQQAEWTVMDNDRLRMECIKYNLEPQETHEKNLLALYSFQETLYKQIHANMDFKTKDQVRHRKSQSEMKQDGKQKLNFLNTIVSDEGDLNLKLKEEQQKLYDRYLNQKESDVGEQLFNKIQVQSNNESFRDKDIDDVPLGPMRKLKPAQKFTILENLQKKTDYKFSQVIKIKQSQETTGLANSIGLEEHLGQIYSWKNTDEKDYFIQQEEFLNSKTIEIIKNLGAAVPGWQNPTIKNTFFDKYTQIKQLNASQNYNFVFRQVVEQLQPINQTPNIQSNLAFQEFLGFSNLFISRMSIENRAKVAQVLKWVDNSTKLAELAQHPDQIQQVTHLALMTKTSIPNILKLCQDETFLTNTIDEAQHSPENIIDQASSCILNFIKIAKQDYILNRTEESDFKKTIEMIQGKVSQIHDLILSKNDLANSLLKKSSQLEHKDHKQLLNRLVLLPVAPKQSKFQELVGQHVKAILAMDMSSDNFQRGLLTAHERNYVIARGMQLQKDSEIQNNIRAVAISERGSGFQNDYDDALNLCYILSGKYLDSQYLNSVYHLAGLRPPTESSGNQSNNLSRNVHSKIDVQHVRELRITLKKQLLNCQTLPQLHRLIEFCEFYQSYSPLIVDSQGKSVQDCLDKIDILNRAFKLPLNDLIRIQNICLLSLSTPTFLFDSILAHPDSFASAVEKPNLNQFIDDILARMIQHQVIFDHLTNSYSILHRQFKPYTKDTFLVLQKVLEDLVNDGGQGQIPVEHFALINKVLSLENVTTKLFDSSEQANSLLNRFLTQQHDFLKTKLSQAQKSESKLTQEKEKKECFEEYDAIFKALRSVKPLVNKNPKLQNLIASSIELALNNLLNDINSFSYQGNLSSSYKSKDNTYFPLDRLIITNKSILEAISSLEQKSSAQVMQKTYFDKMPIKQIIDLTLQINLCPDSKDLHQRGDFLFVKNLISNSLINKAIETEKWGKIERLNGPLITYFNQMLDSKVLSPKLRDDLSYLAENYLLKFRNSRSLFGVDLAQFFKLVDRLQLFRKQKKQGKDNIFDDLIMNVSCNLQTLGVNLLFQVEEDSNEISIGTDSIFKQENADRLEKHRKDQLMIFNMYKAIFNRNPKIFGANYNYGLSPLGVVFAELFDSMSFHERIMCLRILGSHSIDNYSQEIISKIYQEYSQGNEILNFMIRDTDQFITLAEYWPKFLQNTALTQTLTNLEVSKFDLDTQARIVQISTHKNLVMPRFLQGHFQQFIVQSDRKIVQIKMANFVKSIAFVGFTDGINMEQLTQVMRRIYKDPINVETDLLLDFMVILAISNTRYQDYDIKSNEFVERALNLISEQFTGTKNVKVKGKKLYLFNQIPSSQKSYNKILDINSQAFDSDQAHEGKRQREYFQKADNAMTRKFEPEDEHEAYKADSIDHDTSDQSDLSGESSDEDSVQMAGPEVLTKGKHEKRTYDRGYYDMNQGQEEQSLQKLRAIKLGQMAKKDNHLMLYSNVNTLDYIDINTNSIAKAWTTLFHFRGKSIESMLFEEFNAIAQRNTISKTKNHEAFNKLFVRLNQECFKFNLQLNMAGSCERTGWPIDIRVSPFFYKRSSDTSQTSESDSRFTQTEALNSNEESNLYAIYFLLQEEICFNADSKQEEPLGLQKLMLRHLRQISKFRVCTVDENMTANNIESAIAKIQDEFYPLLSEPGHTGKKQSTAASTATSSQSHQLSSQDDFISEIEEEEEEMDDIVDIPQSMF